MKKAFIVLLTIFLFLGLSVPAALAAESNPASSGGLNGTTTVILGIAAGILLVAIIEAIASAARKRNYKDMTSDKEERPSRPSFVEERPPRPSSVQDQVNEFENNRYSAFGNSGTSSDGRTGPQPLPVRCGHCGAELPSGDYICPRCGKNIFDNF